MDTTTGPNPAAHSFFGFATAVSNNGLVVVGKPQLDAAYLYRINETSPTDAKFVFLADLTAAPGDLVVTDSLFGTETLAPGLFFSSFCFKACLLCQGCMGS